MPATYNLRVDWNNDGDFADTGDAIWKRLRSGTPLAMQYGREQSRALSPTVAGQASFLLDNTSHDYSPENTGSPLAGNVKPGRAVLAEATLSAVTYTLFRGYLDDFTLTPGLADQSVSFTCIDALARLREDTVSTGLFQGLRTGDALNAILDAIGWPAAARDIDAGATLIRYWWEDGTSVLEAIQKLVASEGPPAICFVGAAGEIVFRDRHHRITRAASTTSQATFKDTGGEVRYANPLGYQHGWADIINSVTFNVAERFPDGNLTAVWSQADTIALSDGETRIVRAVSQDPFVGAVTPVQNVDYTVTSGAVTVTMLRDSGLSTALLIQASGGPATIAGMQLRAYAVKAVNAVQVTAEDSTSIAENGPKTPASSATPVWAGVGDAQAIADLIVASRAQRIPVVTVRLVGGSDTQLTQQLARDISDRVTINNAELGLSADFFIEQIQHTITPSPTPVHETVFSCEKVPAGVSPVFRFDTAGAGFDQGKFGGGLDDPGNIFRFDTAGQGFDQGVFAH
jgi:hypothetical protein